LFKVEDGNAEGQLGALLVADFLIQFDAIYRSLKR
jgi:hypothetical protein